MKFLIFLLLAGCQLSDYDHAVEVDRLQDEARIVCERNYGVKVFLVSGTDNDTLVRVECLKYVSIKLRGNIKNITMDSALSN